MSNFIQIDGCDCINVDLVESFGKDLGDRDSWVTFASGTERYPGLDVFNALLAAVKPKRRTAVSTRYSNALVSGMQEKQL